MRRPGGGAGAVPAVLATALCLVLWGGRAAGQEADAGPGPAKDAGPGPAQDAGPAPAPAGGTIQANQLSKAPVLTKSVEPEYPPDALAKGVEADVGLLIDIDEHGQVQSVGIAQPADPPDMGFDEAAMVAAQQFEFSPAEADGKPIAVQINYTIHFRLPAGATGKTGTQGTPTEGSAAANKTPPAPAHTPVVNLAGVVRERGTRVPLAGITVTVFRDDGPKPVGFEAPTDEQGHFQFYDLAPGTWKVLADPPGYFPLRTTERVRASERVDVTYYVERGSYNPYDVTVTASRPRKEVSRTVIRAQEIDKIPGTDGDPLNVVQDFAGVARTFGGQLVVRGSAPEDSQFLVDGATVPLIYHFGGLKSVIPVGVLDSIEFYPGNFSPMYGRATGGIVDINIKQLRPKKLGGYADVSILDTGVYLEAPLGDKGGIAVAGRRSYIDGVLNLAVPSDAPVSLVTAPRYYDGQILATYRPAPAHDLRFFLFGSNDVLKLLFANPADLDPSVTSNAFSSSTSFYRGIGTYRFVPSPSFDNTLRLAWGENWLKFRAGQLIFDLDFVDAQIRDMAHKKLGAHLALNAGLDIDWARANAFIKLPQLPSEGQPPTAFDITHTLTTRFDGLAFWSPAAYLEAEVRPVPELLLLPGVRVDGYERTSSVTVEPRFTARWQVAPPFTLKGGVGLFTEEPQFQETDENFGNPDLDPERAIHWSLGGEYKPLPFLTVDLTGFYKRLYHLVSPTDALVENDMGELVPERYDNKGTGAIYGMELVVRHELAHNLTGWIAYTLSRSRRTDSGQSDSRLFDFDQTHILTAVASYLLPRNWQVGARWRLVTGNPMTPVVGSVYNASRDQYEPVYGGVNTDRNPPFHQLDLRVDKRWIYQRWILDAYLDIQNVYDRANPEGLSYNFDFSQSSVQQGLPIVTIIGLRGEF